MCGSCDIGSSFNRLAGRSAVLAGCGFENIDSFCVRAEGSSAKWQGCGPGNIASSFDFTTGRFAVLVERNTEDAGSFFSPRAERSAG